MEHLVNFLATYKDPLGLILNFALLLATLTLIFVGIFQAKAAIAQARTAEAQLREAIRPMLTVEKGHKDEDWTHPNQIFVVKNVGNGPAAHIVIKAWVSVDRTELDSKVTDNIVLPVGQTIPLKHKVRAYTFLYSSTRGDIFNSAVSFSYRGPETVFSDGRVATNKSRWPISLLRRKKI